MDVNTALECANKLECRDKDDKPTPCVCPECEVVKVLAARVRELTPIVRAFSEHIPDNDYNYCCVFCGRVEGEDKDHKPPCAWVLARRAMEDRC